MHPRFLEIEITGRCPYQCKHCYGSFPKPGELTLQNIGDILNDAREFFDCIILSGGEPFLHTGLTDMVEKASREFVVFITTSGFGIAAQHIAQIENRAVLVFGLDGIGRTHDAYRGFPGAFNHLIKALEMTRGMPKEIIVTLWRGVISQIDDIIGLAEKYNAIVHFNGLIPVGRVKDNPEIMPDITELEAVYAKLYRLKMNTGNVITNLHKVTAQDCSQGIELFCRGRFNITPEGNVRPCEFHCTVLGNIHTHSLRAILNQASQTPGIRCRENGFKGHVRTDLKNPFDYHTSICHKVFSQQ